MATLLQAAPPAKFETLSVGSKVQIADLRQEVQSIEGIVLEVTPEWGTHNLPAIQVLEEGQSDPQLIIQDGRWQVTIVADAAKVREMAGVKVPKRAVTVVPVVEEHVAVEYTGGREQSAELIRWTLGRAVVTFDAGDGVNTFDQLRVRSVGGVDLVNIGDYLLENSKGILVVRREDYAERYTTQLR